MKRIVPFVVLLALASTARPAAHQLDEYLQASRVAFARDRVVLEIDLTPGANIFGELLTALDRDADGVVQPFEAHAYGEAVVRDVELTLDDRPVRLTLSTIEVPSVAEMRLGSGTIQLIAESPIDATRSGTRHLRLRNHHHPAASVYLANALVPSDGDIQVAAQRRDRLQQQLDVEYTIASRWSVPLIWVLFGATLVISRVAVRRDRGTMLKMSAITAMCALLAVSVSAQLPALSPAHLNPAIARLASGKSIYGVLTQDLSRENARALGRRDTDFVYIDMEHSPLNMDALANFVAAMNDKAYTVKNGAQPRSALIVRMPAYAGENAAWQVKQALDIGAMGFVFNTVETREQAEAAVKSMRYPPWKAFPNTHKGPTGVRGWSPGGAVWAWGIDTEEYRRRADVWPLNPEGDLMAIMIIETQTGVKNADAIAQVPGVTALSAAAGGDLSSSYGVPTAAPEIESARQTILQACLKHEVLCWITATGKADQDRRLKEGWRMIRTVDGLPFN